jgi:hypothetical protein
MSYNKVPKDGAGIPIASVYVPGNDFASLQGSTTSTLDLNNNLSTPANFNLSQIGSILTQMAGGDGVAANAVLQIANGLYNGTTLDQERGNQDNITVLQVSGGTTTQTSNDMTNYNAIGAILVLDVTSSAPGSITLTLNGKDPVSGKYFSVLTGAAVTTVSTHVYRIYPGLTAVGNATVSDILPRTWQAIVTANTAGAMTYTLGCIYIL